MKQVKVIAFDADDTLWVNEPYFVETENKFCQLLEDYLSKQGLSQELFKTEIHNLQYYGYGIKGYILSMIEAALQITNQTIKVEAIGKIIDFGKELLQKPIELLDGVEDALQHLKPHYKLVVATKGDLLDQHRKLTKSGLGHYFHHIEVMSDKQVLDYQKLVTRLEINPSELLMIGNSLKSDILPVLELGGYAAHIPFHTTWEHEKVDYEIAHPHFKHLTHINEVVPWIRQFG
jgi:putative hydrolase of the HAD superfamily